MEEIAFTRRCERASPKVTISVDQMVDPSVAPSVSVHGIPIFSRKCDQQMDGGTDGQTDWHSYRDSRARLKCRSVLCLELRTGLMTLYNSGSLPILPYDWQSITSRISPGFLVDLITTMTTTKTTKITTTITSTAATSVTPLNSSDGSSCPSLDSFW